MKSLVVMHFGNAGDSFLPVQYSSAQFDWPSDYFPHHLAQKCERGITLHYTTPHYTTIFYVHCVQIRKTGIIALGLCSRRKKYSQPIWD